MGVARNILLWGSRNEKLREMLPRYGFVRRSVSRFMPGEEPEDALNATQELKSHGRPTVLTHLGENVRSVDETHRVTEHYLHLLDLIRERGLDSQISVKLTELGLDQDQELCHQNVVSLAAKAADCGNFLWIDMEGSPYTTDTLREFERLRKEHSNTGLCLQSYLHRTEEDLRRLLPLSPRIRLVKGAYAEPPEIAFAKKSDTDENFFRLAITLLELSRDKGAVPGIATHDDLLIRRIVREAGSRGIAQDRFEFQMLYGIRNETQQQLVKDGFKVRTLISYGSFWFPWYMRRLAERPANVSFVLRNMFR